MAKATKPSKPKKEDPALLRRQAIAQEISVLYSNLRTAISRVPPRVVNGSYQVAVAWKETAKDAAKEVARISAETPRTKLPPLGQLEQKRNRLQELLQRVQ